MVTDEGFLGKIMRSFGLSPSQTKYKGHNNNKPYMTKIAYITILEALQSYEREVPRVLSNVSKERVLIRQKEKIISEINNLSNKEKISPKSTANNLIESVETFHKRIILKIQAKKKEDQQIISRKHEGIITNPVLSRIHTNKNVIMYVENLIDQISTKIAEFASVPSRKNIKYRNKQKAELAIMIRRSKENIRKTRKELHSQAAK